MSHQQNMAFLCRGSWTAQSGFFFAPAAGKVHAHTEYLYFAALEETFYFPLLRIAPQKGGKI